MRKPGKGDGAPGRGRPGPPRGSPKDVGRALRYLGHYKGATFGALGSLLLVTAANLVTPQLIRIVIDQGLAKRLPHLVVISVAGLVGIALVRGVFNFLQGYLAERASQGVAFDLRDALFARIQRLSFSYYDQAQTGQLLTRLTNDVEQMRMFVGTGVIQLVAAVAMFIGSAALLFWTNALLALVSLLAIAPIFWVLRNFVGKMGPLFMKVQSALGRLNTVLQEDLRGLKVVRTFSAEAREVARYGGINDELRDHNLQVIDAISLNFPMVGFFASMGTLAVVGFGGLQIFRGHLTIGELVAFNTYLAFLLMPIMTLGFLAAQLARAGTSAKRVFELLDTAVEVKDRPGAVPLPEVQGRVEFDDVHFRYGGSERPILQGVSFVAEPGELVAILGTTGSGKSTIINLLPRFYEPTSGAVRIDGHDIREVTLSSLRSQIGIVLQDALLFSGTVRDNIAYGRPEAPQDEVKRVAQLAQAAEFIEALPQQYDTVIGERGVGLSGGQRQRIAIARALLTQPRILILDDSTSAVDAQTEAAIQGALDRLMRESKRTAIVIAQRLSTVRDANRIVVLDAGKVVAQGTWDELLATSEVFNQILGSQLQPASSQGAGEGAA